LPRSVGHAHEHADAPHALALLRARRERPSDCTLRDFDPAMTELGPTMIYKAWQEGWGPRFYLNGVSRRITHEARLEWQRQREQAAREAASREGGEAA
jgi:hypothetical protein